MIPDAVMAGVDAARAAAQLGFSQVAIVLVHSAARAAALNGDDGFRESCAIHVDLTGASAAGL